MRLAFLWLLCALSILFSLPARADMTAEERMTDQALRHRAESLYKVIRCVVCQSQSIDGSNAEIAAALRAEVRRQLKDGHDDEAILNSLRNHYGDAVLLKPPFRTGTWLLWLMPLLLLGGGGLIAAKTLRGRA